MKNGRLAMLQKKFIRSACTVSLVFISACSSVPVNLGTPLQGKVPDGASRPIAAEGCGFQLLVFFPIMINDRAERAYRALEAQAGGDLITDVQVSERWTYGFVGTEYCTDLRAKAIRRTNTAQTG